MALLEIKKFKDPILRKQCAPVVEFGTDLKELVKDMIETMQKNNGVGLAAPQVGVSKRIIVVDLNQESPRFLVLVNPLIIQQSPKKEIGEEGCLSFPGVYLQIERSNEVVVEGFDENGKEVRIEAKELLARVLQHEIDHLDGILFFDRLPFWQKLKFKLSIISKL